MYSNNKVAKAVRLAMMVGAGAASMASVQAYAAEDGANKDVERIEVTGSRIKRTDIETPVPITVISRSDIVEMGALNVSDILNQSPVTIAGSDQSNTSFTNSSVGVNTTALRNLGESRTLVLVNGRRFVSGVSPSSGYAVDLNSIPTSMIERIEILKSASSAVYGSDAVAGVVNIITRSDFEGVEVNAQSGISSKSDRKKYALNITAGNAWNTGNFTMAIGYDKDGGLKSTDRKFSALDQAILLDDNGNEYVGNLFSSYPPQGRISGKNSNGERYSFNGNGTPFTGETGKFNRASFRQLVTPIERKYAAFNLKQELSDSVRYFAEFNWNSSATNGSTTEPTPFNIDNVFLPSRGGQGGISVGSPLLPDSLRNALLGQGLSLTDNIPGLVRRMVEFGARSTDVERDTVRVATGFDWDINDSWALNTYLDWGKTDQKQQNGGQINVERAAEAFDVDFNTETGKLQCASELARLHGCAPLNLFGAGTASQDAVDYVKVPAKVTGQAEQFILAASLTGELPIELSGGNIGVAFGYEHRLENGRFNPGDLAQTGASSTNKSAATKGSFTTDDIFAETILPVLDNLEVDLAARYSDHSIVGKQTTWNAGVSYSPIEELKFRASAARAIRTPNIADLFGGRGETFASVSDPCNGIDASSTGNAAINCLSIAEVAARVASNGKFALTQVEAQSTGGTVGGSINVKEETADTYSAGVIWQVMDGLSLTVDYYDISVNNAISTTSRTTVLNRCFDVSPSAFDATCAGAVLRDANGALTEVDSGTSNENKLDTKGIDLELSYSVDIAGGNFTADLLWNHIAKYNKTSIDDGTVVKFAGQVFTPKNRANLNLGYKLDDLSFAWRMRYWESSLDSVEGSNYNYTNFEPLTTYNRFGGVVYSDISAGYDLNDNTNVMLTVRNVFDKQPPVANQGSASGGVGINTVSEAFDVTGRYFQLSVTSKF